jgi:hypothetical protein
MNKLMLIIWEVNKIAKIVKTVKIVISRLTCKVVARLKN